MLPIFLQNHQDFSPNQIFCLVLRPPHPFGNHQGQIYPKSLPRLPKILYVFLVIYRVMTMVANNKSLKIVAILTIY